MSPKQPKRSFLRWVDRLTKTPFFSSRKFQKLKCGEGCPGLMVETNDGLDDSARDAWFAQVRALTTRKSLNDACKARGIEVYEEREKKIKNVNTIVKRPRSAADLRDDLYNVDPSLYEIDVLPESCPRKIPWLVDQGLYNLKHHYEERMETSPPPQNAGESVALYTKRIFQLVLDLGPPEDLKKRKSGEVKKYEEETFEGIGDYGACAKCRQTVTAHPWKCDKCGVNCASCVHEEGKCNYQEGRYRCKPCSAKYGTPIFTTSPKGGSFIHGSVFKQMRGRVFIDALGENAHDVLIRIAKVSASIEVYELKVKLGCMSGEAACRRWTLAEKSMSKELMDTSKEPHRGIVVEFENFMEKQPAGADALDVAKRMVKEVHPGYKLVVIMFEEKLVRSRAHG